MHVTCSDSSQASELKKSSLSCRSTDVTFWSSLSLGSLIVAELKRKRPCPHREYKDLFFQTILCFPLRKNDFFLLEVRLCLLDNFMLYKNLAVAAESKACFREAVVQGREAFLREMCDCRRVSFELCLQFSIDSFEIDRFCFSYCCRVVLVSLNILDFLRN